MLLQTPANAGVFLWSIRSSQKPRIPTTYSLFLWDDSNGLDLHQVVRLRQSRHEHYGDQRRVGPATPHALKYFKGRHRRLTLHNVDVPLDDVFQLRTPGLQRRLRVLENLFCLSCDVVPSDHLAGCVHLVLAPNVHRPYVARGNYGLAVGRVLVQSLRIEVFHAPSHRGIHYRGRVASIHRAAGKVFTRKPISNRSLVRHSAMICPGVITELLGGASCVWWTNSSLTKRARLLGMKR